MSNHISDQTKTDAAGRTTTTISNLIDRQPQQHAKFTAARASNKFIQISAFSMESCHV